MNKYIEGRPYKYLSKLTANEPVTIDRPYQLTDVYIYAIRLSSTDKKGTICVTIGSNKEYYHLNEYDTVVLERRRVLTWLSEGTITLCTDVDGMSCHISGVIIATGETVSDEELEQEINEDPLRFTAKEDNSSIKYTIGDNRFVVYYREGSIINNTIEYKNKGKWTKYISHTIKLDTDNFVEFKRLSDKPNDLYALYLPYTYRRNDDNKAGYPIGLFNMTGVIAASGNIQSMMNYSDIAPTHCYYCLFAGCSSLIEAPSLPATILEEACYAGMFWGCANLKQAPILPSVSLSPYCYHGMFSNCNSLIYAPSLPSSMLAPDCYSFMFSGCTNMEVAPSLPSIDMQDHCYAAMFNDCTSLLVPPELPATKLAPSCYYEMFAWCTSLSTPPDLPAMELAPKCYGRMFYSCTGLTHMPELKATYVPLYAYERMFYGTKSLTQPIDTLPATVVEEGSYFAMFGDSAICTPPTLPCIELKAFSCAYMFYKCSNIKQAPPMYSPDNSSSFMDGSMIAMFRESGVVSAPLLMHKYLDMLTYFNLFYGATDIAVINTCLAKWNDLFFSTTLWTQGVANSGIFYKNAELDVKTGPDNIPSTWDIIINNKVIDSYPTESVAGTEGECPLRLTSHSSNSFVIYSIMDNEPVYYRKHSDAEWVPYITNTRIDLADNEFIEFRRFSSQGNVINATRGIGHFILAGVIHASGNIQSLMDYADTAPNYCYAEMFLGCTSLVTAPPLPAISLYESCYSRMFYKCTSLIKAPELPANILKENCYAYMFDGCTSLNYISVNFTNWIDTATTNWVIGTNVKGVFNKPAQLVTEYGESRIPFEWEVVNN